MDSLFSYLATLFNLPPSLFVKSTHHSLYRSLNLAEIINDAEYHLQHRYLQSSSLDAIRAMSRLLSTKWFRGIEDRSQQSVFFAPIRLSRDLFTWKDEAPVCRIEEFLSWNRISLLLGEDLFTTAFATLREQETGQKPIHFQWGNNIKSDFHGLNNLLLNRRVAENHMHLFGSAPHLDLSWLSLMNRPRGRNREFQELYATPSLAPQERSSFDHRAYYSLYDYVKIAAAMRLALFALCVLEDDSFFLYLVKRLQPMLWHQASPDAFFSAIVPRIELYRTKSVHREFGRSVDYCINFHTREGLTCGALAGERKLYYAAFKYIIKQRKYLGAVERLFYSYILIKQKFGNEFIQRNDRPGFLNFRQFQDRKTLFLGENTVYRRLVPKMAIYENQQDNAIDLLEARISPKSTDRLAQSIDEIDRICACGYQELSIKPQCPLLPERGSHHFYVLHFHKRTCDFVAQEYKETSLHARHWCRDHKLRQETKQSALDIAQLRNANCRISSRIFGIDAAAKEIDCRPEVFAQAFRFLRDHRSNRNAELVFGVGHSAIPPLRVTYHVGEDFYDLVDGLRAIDECILFLKMRHGDRIGHGLALGMNALDYYEGRQLEIVLPQQNLLDNIAWMLDQIQKGALSVSSGFVYGLKQRYQELFNEVYREAFQRDNTYEQLSLFYSNPGKYLDAWRLRGDAPEAFRAKVADPDALAQEKKIQRRVFSQYNMYRFLKGNDSFQKLDWDTYFLHHLYHYDIGVKTRGNVFTNFTVDEEYVRVVSLLQQQMRDRVMGLGIAVEANPSSNIMIGGLKHVADHPVFTMFPIREKEGRTKRMNLSINTDDQGIFSTSLVKEYTLLASCLMSDQEDGMRKHSDDEILHWIERLIENGIVQSFYDEPSATHRQRSIGWRKREAKKCAYLGSFACPGSGETKWAR